MAPFESGRRLCLLFQAGGVRYAIEATSVVEVAPPDSDGNSIRGFLELKDLSILMGGGAERRPGMAVVLDVSPTLALRIDQVVEVADVARASFFLLPPALSSALALVVRGALLHQGRLYLELVAEALPHRGTVPSVGLSRPIYLVDQAPERALLFESHGKFFGIPLPLVSQVVSRSSAFCPFPSEGGPVAGFFPHAQVLWPIYSASGLLGEPALNEELFILTELAGQSVGICASRVLGVHQRFSGSTVRGEFVSPTAGVPALFLDLQRMFS